MKCLDLKEITDGLELRDGIWFSNSNVDVSFPEDGYNRCFQVETDSFWFIHRNDCIIETVKNFPPGDCFFDIGGGNGFVSLELEKNGINTCLVEPGIEGILNAQKRKLKNLVCASFEEAHFYKNSLPAVGIFDVLEHIHNDDAFLSGLSEALVYNGRLFLTAPAFNALWSPEDDYAGHFRRYTIKSISRKLEAVNFKVEYGSYIFSILPVPIFLFRSIPGRIFKKKQNRPEKMQKQCRKRTGTMGKILNSILKKELSMIKRKRKIAIGSSCLLVARNLSK